MDSTTLLAGGALAAYLAWSNKDVLGAWTRRLFARGEGRDLDAAWTGYKAFDRFASENKRPDVRDHAAKAMQCAMDPCEEHEKK